MADYGMVAKEDIEEGEILFTIPRSALLHQETTKVSGLLKKGESTENEFYNVKAFRFYQLPNVFCFYFHREVVSGELFWLGPPAAGFAL